MKLVMKLVRLFSFNLRCSLAFGTLTYMSAHNRGTGRVLRLVWHSLLACIGTPMLGLSIITYLQLIVESGEKFGGAASSAIAG